MSMDSVMRRSLQLTTAFNFLAAFCLAYPATPLAQLMGLPSGAPLIYRAMAAGAVALFGLAYGWLSVQPIIDRPLVVLSTIGKLAAFGSVVALTIYGDLPTRSILMTSPDLLFAVVFICWLHGAQPAVPADVPASGPAVLRQGR